MVFRDEDGIELTIRFDHVRGELVLASIDTAAAEVRNEREHAAPVDPAPTGGTPACAEDRTVEKLTQAEWRAEGLLRLAEESRRGAPRRAARLGVRHHRRRPRRHRHPLRPRHGTGTARGPDPITESGVSGAPDIGDDEPDVPPDRRPAWALPPPAALAQRRDNLAELEPAGVAIRRDVARWLACDAGILTVIEDPDGNPLHIGRRRSSVPLALRRAVHARHRTCAWPGCTATAVQVHHIRHRADGGHDDIENLVPECPVHHRTIHLEGIWITVDPDGTVHHWRRDGTEILANPTTHQAPVTDALEAPDLVTTRRLALGADPDETARQPRWHGDPLHLHDCITAIQSRRDAALQRTTPTRAAPLGPPPRTAHPRERVA